jgi:Protein of unknown function (DUF2631)
VENTEVERHTGVDTEDVPSANWGWSYMSLRVMHIGGLLVAAFLLMMIKGNQVGHIEDWWLTGFAVLIVVFVVRDWWLRRRGWIR